MWDWRLVSGGGKFTGLGEETSQRRAGNRYMVSIEGIVRIISSSNCGTTVCAAWINGGTVDCPSALLLGSEPQRAMFAADRLRLRATSYRPPARIREDETYDSRSESIVIRLLPPSSPGLC